jgi:hypothetical protein
MMRMGRQMLGWGKSLGLVGLVWFVCGGVVFGQDLASFEQRVTQHTLKNGWTFIIVERPVAPVFAFMTRVNVGSAQESTGQTGLAHMFEHMAFKGTPRIGTTDYEAEKKALVALEEAYQAYQTEKFAPGLRSGDGESPL